MTIIKGERHGDRIVEADRRYYLDDAPELSDADYDALLRELRALEDANPELITDDSPTRTVRGATSSTFAAVVHRVPMTSLDNAMDADELRAWGERVGRGYEPDFAGHMIGGVDDEPLPILTA